MRYQSTTLRGLTTSAPAITGRGASTLDVKPKISGLLFDKDGTLFDFAHTWESWAEGFLLRTAKGDRDFAAKVGRAIGFDLDARKFARDSVVIAATAGEIAEAMIDGSQRSETPPYHP